MRRAGEAISPVLDFSFRNLSSIEWLEFIFCPLVFVCLHTLLFVPVLLLVIQKFCTALILR